MSDVSQAPVVILIHGTFAKDDGDLWSRPDSTFAQALRKELPVNTEIQSFNWFSESQHNDVPTPLDQSSLPDSMGRDFRVIPKGQAMGPNSEAQRRTSGRHLFEQLCTLETQKRPYYLVAHSHGGSVIWHALCRSAEADVKLNGLRSWSSFGTPYLTFAPSPFSLSRFLAWSLVFVTTGLLGFSMLYELIWRPGDSAQAILARLGWLELSLLALATAILLAGLCAPLLAAIRWVGARLGHARSRQVIEAKAARWYGDKARIYWHGEDEVMFLMRLSFAPAPDITPKVALFQIGEVRRASNEYVWRTLGHFLQGNDVAGLSVSSVGRCPAALSSGGNLLKPDDQSALLALTGQAAGETLAAIRQQLSTLSGLPTWAERMDLVRQIFNWNEVIHTAYYRMPTFPNLVAAGFVTAPAETMPAESHRAGPPPRALERARTGAILAACLVIGAGGLAIFRDALLPNTNVAQDFEMRSEIRKLGYHSLDYRLDQVVWAAMSRCSFAPVDDIFAGIANLEVRWQVASDLARTLGRAGWLHHISSLQRAYTLPLTMTSSKDDLLQTVLHGERGASDDGCAGVAARPAISDPSTARLWSAGLIGMAEGGHLVDAQTAVNVLRYYSEPRRHSISPTQSFTVEDWSSGVLALLRRAYIQMPERLLSGASPSILRELEAMMRYDVTTFSGCAPGFLLSNPRFMFAAAISKSVGSLSELLGKADPVDACLGATDERPRLSSYLRRIGQTGLSEEIEQRAPATARAVPPKSATGPASYLLTYRCKQSSAAQTKDRLLNVVSIYKDFVAWSVSRTGEWPAECNEAGLGNESAILASIFTLERNLLAEATRSLEFGFAGLSELFVDVRELVTRSETCERTTPACVHGMRALDAATRYLAGSSVRDGTAKRDDLARSLALNWQWHRETKRAVNVGMAVANPSAALSNLTLITRARTKLAAPSSERVACRALMLDPAVKMNACL